MSKSLSFFFSKSKVATLLLTPLLLASCGSPITRAQAIVCAEDISSSQEGTDYVMPKRVSTVIENEKGSEQVVIDTQSFYFRREKETKNEETTTKTISYAYLKEKSVTLGYSEDGGISGIYSTLEEETDEEYESIVAMVRLKVVEEWDPYIHISSEAVHHGEICTQTAIAQRRITFIDDVNFITRFFVV